MMSRMQKQMGGMPGGEEMDPEEALAQAGNRKSRRNAKKQKKGGRGGGKGFWGGF